MKVKHREVHICIPSNVQDSSMRKVFEGACAGFKTKIDWRDQLSSLGGETRLITVHETSEEESVRKMWITAIIAQ